MVSGAIISYDENAERPRAVLALGNGDRVVLSLSRDGFTIVQLGAAEAILFQADSELTSRLCAGLIASDSTPPAPAIRLLVAAIVQLNSAAEIKRAFEDVADQLS
jgi:hypothetical protein